MSLFGFYLSNKKEPQTVNLKGSLPINLATRSSGVVELAKFFCFYNPFEKSRKCSTSPLKSIRYHRCLDEIFFYCKQQCLMTNTIALKRIFIDIEISPCICNRYLLP